MRKIIEIPVSKFPKGQNKKEKLRVAAYCRVSTEQDEQEHSLENQIETYRKEIEENENWELVDIFSDFGVSGLNDNKRTEFMRMIDMCNEGKIDLILVKSISRFSRNHADYLKHIKNLKSKNIGIRFDKEGINTLDPSSEMFLTFFSIFAQAESESISMNVTRGIRNGYKRGEFFFPNMYGYERDDNGNPLIIKDEANVVKNIFHLYLEGYSINDLKMWLAKNNIKSPKGEQEWNKNTITEILKNEKYMGDVLLQKSYTVDFLTKTRKENKGEVSQYYIENNHDGIVSKDVFNAVQDKIKRRADKYMGKGKKGVSKYALTGKLVCGECGALYKRVTKTKRNGDIEIVWRCSERLNTGKRVCKNSPTILENDLHERIIEHIEKILGKNDVDKTVAEILESVLFKEDEYNQQVIKKNIKKYKKELILLESILKDTDDKRFYLEKIERVKIQIAELENKLATADITCNTRIGKIDLSIKNYSFDKTEYVNAIVRNVIDEITVLFDGDSAIKYINEK